MRKALTHILKSDASIEVADTAEDGEKALQTIKQIHPDVVLLDIEMPVMDGLAALAHIMAECPTPVLMLSALNKRDSTIAVTSLNYGAVDFIAKPSGVISYDIDTLSREIITKVKIAADVNVRKFDLHHAKDLYLRPRSKAVKRKKNIVIGASTGGPRAVGIVLSGLPHDISSSVIIVQHMNQEFVPSFVERLKVQSPLSISMAKRGEVLDPGQVLVAPGGYHTMIIKDGQVRKISLRKKVSPQAVFPSIDYTMESAAKAYGEETLGVLLTGIGSDGAKGLKTIKEAGGSTIAEDESTCVVFGMPKAAIEMNCVDEIVPLPHIAQAILRKI